MKKKKILIQTDFSLAVTGFGRFSKALLEYLFKTNKYDIVHFAVGSIDGNPDLNRTPWKSVGCVNPIQLQEIKQQQDPKNWEQIDRVAGYGAYSLDGVVKQEKPDVFIGVQDIWGIDFSVDKPWFKKISSVFWTTLDSLPILPKAIEVAPKVKNYWSWAEFATKALHKLGHKHVKTVRGAIDTKNFFKLSDSKKLELRKQNNISEKTFVVGFVFRNQLRKSVPNLLQGFKQFKKENPTLDTKLLLHTHWAEGWDILSLTKELELNPQDILTTYICKQCRKYEIKPFQGHDIACKFCGSQNGLTTTHPTIGVSEQQLNEVYNLMDVYCHPFTSGGQEIPIQEAKLTELVTLVTNYSCGEDCCNEEAGSLTLDWAEYREPGTQFIKASTYPSSITKQLNKVFNMKENSRREIGKKAREWVINNFSVEVIGKFVEEFIDNCPYVENYSFSDGFVTKNPHCEVPNIEDNEKWLIFLYENILKREEKDENGIKYWLAEMSKGTDRVSIERYFRQVALNENNQNQNLQTPFESFLNQNDKGRVIFVMPESAGDILLCTSLFRSIKERYSDWSLYVATKKEYKDIIDGNPYVDKWLEYNPMMDNHQWLTGNSNHNGFFNIAYHPYWLTQRTATYYNNGQDIIHFDTKY